MFFPSGYISATEFTHDFHEWFGHIWRRGVAQGFIEDQGITRQVDQVFSALRSFLGDTEEVFLCGPDGSVLKVVKEHFLDRTSERNLWQEDWFPDHFKNEVDGYFFLDGDTYTVSLVNWNESVEPLLRENAISLWLDLSKTARVVAQFENWALCLKDGQQEKIPDYIVDYTALTRKPEIFRV